MFDCSLELLALLCVQQWESHDALPMKSRKILERRRKDEGEHSGIYKWITHESNLIHSVVSFGYPVE